MRRLDILVRCFFRDSFWCDSVNKTGKGLASLVLSWVVKYKIKVWQLEKNHTVFPSVHSFCCSVLGSPVQSGGALKGSKTNLFSPLSGGRSVYYTRTVKPNCKNAPIGSDRAFGFRIDPFDLFCLMSLGARLQYARGRFLFTCSAETEKGGNKRIFVFQAGACQTPDSLSQLGSVCGSGKGNLRSKSFSSIKTTSVNSDPHLC